MSLAGIVASAFGAPPGTILPAGTLPVLRNIQSGISGITTNGSVMSITQNQRAAIINWNQFNIARGSRVEFLQPDAGARVLNRIFDSDPSIIQGQLSANGQVLLLNRNGILFDRGSQINVGTLYASTLNITDADFNKGFAASAQGSDTNPFTRFDLFKDASGNPLPSGPILVNVHGPATDASGAAVPPATLASASQGAIVLIAPAIDNRGVIVSPDGQVILAAGKTAYLWQRNTDTTGDPRAGALRGMMVEITAGADNLNVSNLVANSVTNSGTILADRGNISVAALAINQKGIVSAGSSVVSNGSVWLTARSIPDTPYINDASGNSVAKLGDSDAGRPAERLGSVLFGAGSFTGTPLLTDSGRLSQSDSYSNFQATTVGNNNSVQTFSRDFRSWVHVVGNTIQNQGTVQSPGGVMELLAQGYTDPVTSQFVAPRILLEAGSTVSAAGDWVDKSVADNIVQIQRLTSNDLKDSPLQRSGANSLVGTSVAVDLRQPNALFSLQPYIDNQQNTVQDKATAGGDIRIEARQGEVISAPGSVIDVSGGGFRYAAGSYTTTRLLGTDAKAYSLCASGPTCASPLRTYSGTADAITTKFFKAGPLGWNLSRSYATLYKSNPTSESAYLKGADAGTLSIVAPRIAALGDWRGGVSLGRYQVNQDKASATPRAGTLTIGDVSGVAGGAVDFGIDRISFGAATALPVGFGLGSALPADASGAGLVLPADQYRFAGLAAESFAYQGFGNLALFANGKVTVPAGTGVLLPPGGTFSARTSAGTGIIELGAAQDGRDGGSITAPAGRVSLASDTVRLGGAQWSLDGSLVSPGARIDAGGLVSADARMSKDLPAGGGFTARSAGNLTEYVTNNIGALLDDLSTASGRPSGAVVAPAFAVNAASGSITLSGRAVDLERGSSLSAMGGLKVAANNAVTAGNGGSIAITANAGVTSVTDPSGSLRMDGDLYGYALGTGATLQVQSRSMRVTDSEAGGAPIGPGNVGGDPATGDLKLAPGFFRTGGFTGYTLTGQAGMDIDPGIQLRPQAQALQVGVLSLDRSQRLAASGTTRLSSGSGDGAVAASLSVRDVVVDYEAGRIEARPATSLAFKLAPNNAYPGVGSLTLGAGASIVADPGAKVSFEFSPLAGTALPDSKGIELLGSVKAPGGTISATVSYPALQSGATLAQFDPAHPDNDRQSGLVHVGPGSTLSTKAVFVSQVGGSNAFGNVRASDGSVGKGLRTQGSVTSGGAIALSATNARVNIDAGSLLDVSAAAATVDLPELANAAGPSIFAPQTIWGDAGSISVSSTDASRLAGTMNAQAAGQGSGGSFALNFVRATPFGDPLLARSITDHRVVLTAGAPDSNERTQLGANAFSTARVSANALGAAGFSSVAIKSDNSIELSGSLNLRPSLSLTLDAPVLDVRGSGTPLVQLSTNRLTLMNSTGNTVRANFNPAVPGGPVATSSGNGILFANGRLVDLIGTVTINGVNGDEDPATGDKVRSLVINSSGDLRLTGLPVKLGRTTNADQTVDALVGALNSQADIELRAQQVYPTSMSEFTLSSQSVIGGVGTNSGTVRIAQVPGTPGPVVSAGGKLFLQGSAVEQSGTLKAPLGRIELNADSVQLNTGSLTSVSLLDGSAGQTVPFGETLNGRSWYYDLSPVATAGTVNPNASLTLTSPGEKKIVAKGATVSIAPGAVVDLRGGGDVQAFEFVPGPGGSKDVLQSTASNQTWAVLPSMRLADAPLDTHLAARSGVATTAAPGTYNTIFLKGVKGVADGFYPLLDAHYALLPGALQVTKVTGSAAAAYADLPAGPGKSLLDKTQVISTWRGVAGSPVREARTAGYIVQSGEAARTASQLDTNSSAFFAATAGDNPVPRLPADAGNLALLPTASLTLLGDLKTGAASGGLGAQVDISANSIKVVDSVDPAAPADPAFVTLGADVLNRLSGSLLLGGTRSGALLTANAQKVVVANSAAQPLALSEVLIAARDTVDVQAGAVIDATAAGLSGSAAIAAGNKGALLRASSGVQVEVSRGSSVDTSGGILNVSGTVRAPSVIFDATRNTTFDGVLQQAKSFSVSAGAVAIGDTGNFKPGGSAFAGLALNADRLNSFSTLDALSIRSYSSIALVGASTVGSKALASLALDAGEIAGFQARDATGSALARLDAAGAPLPTVLSASTVTLRNSSASPRGTGTPDGTAKLKLESDRLVLGAGDKGLRGFSAVNAVAATELAESGTGTLTVASGMRVSAPRLVGSAGADQGISAASYDGATQFALTVDPDAATAGGVPATSATTGGRWALAGKSVSFSTAIDAPSGTVEIAARGAGPSDGVTLGSGAVVGVAGVTRSFTGAIVSSSGGQVKLSADAGDVSIAAGAALDLSSPGSAGRLSLLAPNGAVTLAGSVNGVGIDPGSATVDAKTLPDLTGLNRSLNEGGMTGARVIRQRTGELKVAAGEIVKASHVSLSADTGNITLEGTVDVSGAAGGGRAGLFAGQDLTLASGSLIDARGTSQGTGGSAPIANGGTVEVSAARGLLNFQPGATVDVSAGAKGDAGSVTFAAARTAVGTSLPITLAGTLDATPGASGAAASVVVRGDRAYTLSSLTTSTTNTFTSANPVWNEYNNFMSNAPAFSVSGTNASVRAGIEIRSPADLTLGSVWDLTNSNWNRNGVPALLTLRATGNLNINSTLGLPDPPTTGTIGNQALPTGQSWSMRLVGGADMGAANPLAVVPLTTLTAAGKGDVVLQDNNTSSIGKVRTGSGDIEIAAGRDFRLGDSSLATNGNRAVVYTAGIAQVPSSVDPTQRFTSGGGDVRITAQRDAVGSMVIAPQVDSNGNPTNPIGKAGEFVNDWLRRTSLPAGSSSAQRLVELPGSWWVYRPNFRGNIGSFGGGDIAVVAGRDVVNLGASAPTSGRGSVDTASNTAVGSVVALAPDAAGNAVLEVRGGGNVGVSAGRNIQGGEYLVALGTGNISATGSVGAGGSPTGLFLMGQGNVGLGSDTSRSSASIQVAALGNVTLQSISNPTILASTQPTATSGNRLATVGFGGSRDAFFTYAPDSEAQVISVNGDVTVGRAAMVKPSSTTPSIISAEWSTVAPPKLLLAAMSGSVTQTGTPGDVTRPIDLYPSTTGQLAVFAGKDVVNLNATAFNVVPDALPLWNHPGAGGGVNTSYTLGSGVASVAGRTTAGTVGDLFAASLPRLTTSDATSGRTLYAVEAGGDVLSPTLQMPARSSVRAGRDLVSGVLNAQNLSAADVSVVAAGRDIVADPLRYKGDPSKSLGINFAGPGTGVVQSGRNIDLGSSTGIVADGSARNGSLNTNTSARLVVLAGVKGIVDVNVIDSLMSVSRLFGLMSAASSAKAVRGPDVKAAIAAADSRDPASLQRLDDALAATLVVPDQVKDVTDAALAAREALASVRFAIARGAQPALLDTLLSGLGVVSGVDRLPVAVSGATNVLSTGNVAGTDAANQFLAGAIQLANTELRSTAGVRNTVSVGGATLLVAPDPAKAFATVAFANNATGPGNIDMFSTKLQTTGGSGIDLVAPGFNAAGKSAGVVNAGLPSGSKGNVGITTQAGGAIRAYVSSDFNVNQSKVLTAQGGDIMLYTSDGNIDAGRGALTSRSSSPPRRVAVFNNNGEFIGFVYLPPIDATGSGIRTLTSDPDGPGPQFAPPAGNIYLFATKGKIDAGEAGIASGGSITVRGDVANAGNISGSNASGVPSTVSTSVGALAGPGPGTTKRDGDDPTKGLPPTAAGPAENAPRLAILSVEVLRFGEGPDEQPASRTAGPQKPDETRRGR